MTDESKTPQEPQADEPEAFDPSAFSTPPATPAVKKGPGGALTIGGEAVPDWLKAEGELGTEDLKAYQTTPRLGIVQANSDRERKASYGEGSVVIFPDGDVVAKLEEDFIWIPLAFFPNWEKRSDFNDKNSDFILESTMDEKSEVARKSRSKADRKEPYPNFDPANPLFYKYVQNLNFVALIVSGPMTNTIATLTFNNANHFQGERLAGLFRRRGIALWANRVKSRTEPQNWGGNDFYGLAVNNPSPEEGGAFVKDQEQYEFLKNLNAEFNEMIANDRLRVNREGEEVIDTEGRVHDDGLEQMV